MCIQDIADRHCLITMIVQSLFCFTEANAANHKTTQYVEVIERSSLVPPSSNTFEPDAPLFPPAHKDDKDSMPSILPSSSTMCAEPSTSAVSRDDGPSSCLSGAAAAAVNTSEIDGNNIHAPRRLPGVDSGPLNAPQNTQFLLQQSGTVAPEGDSGGKRQQQDHQVLSTHVETAAIALMDSMQPGGKALHDPVSLYF